MTIEEARKSIIDKIVAERRKCRCKYQTCQLPDPLALPDMPEGAEIVELHSGRVSDSAIRELQEYCEKWNLQNPERERKVLWQTGEWHECDTARGEYGAPYVFDAKYNVCVVEVPRKG